MLIGRTLGLYLSWRFVRAIALVFGTVFALVYTLDFVELLRRAGDAEGASAGLLARLSLYRTPSIAEQVFPFAVLFGAMTTLLGLSRKLELVVARAAGISAWQFLQPGVAVALGLGLFSVAVYNPVSATLKERATAIEATLFGRKGRTASGAFFVQQRSLDGSAVIRAEGGSEETGSVTGIQAFVFDKAGRFLERVDAPGGVLHEGYWEFRDARVLAEGQEPQIYGAYLLATNLQASQFRQSVTRPDSVPFWRLPDVIAQTQAAGFDPTRYRLQYATLLARPLLFVAMIALAASVSLRFFRFGGVGKTVLGGVAAGFVLYAVTEIMRDLGGAGLVRPAVAAWFPAVVGSLLGTLALLYQEDG